ncbi:putative acetyltransferase [Microbacterium sp. CJ88]|uniref:putative acetyltransferase n=1 Tax=Microbacterium sp. CJ88 TaxID=3445672 RepID=UPI003F65CA94
MVIRLPEPGHRVVVRYLLPSGQATDALGMLVAADAETVIVDGKRGVERIPRSAIIAAKAVPPPPPPRRPHAAPLAPPPPPAVE